MTADDANSLQEQLILGPVMKLIWIHLGEWNASHRKSCCPLYLDVKVVRQFLVP